MAAHLLKQFSLFQTLQDAQLEKFAAVGEMKTVPTGQTIFEEGTVSSEFYLLEEGKVEISKNVAGGRRRVLKHMAAPDLFGELALFDQSPRSARATAECSCRVRVFPRDKLFRLLQEDRTLAVPFLTGVIREICARLRSTNEKLNEGVMWGFQVQD